LANLSERTYYLAGRFGEGLAVVGEQMLNDVVLNQVLVWRDDLAGAGGRANQCRHGRRATRISSVA